MLWEQNRQLEREKVTEKRYDLLFPVCDLVVGTVIGVHTNDERLRERERG